MPAGFGGATPGLPGKPRPKDKEAIMNACFKGLALGLALAAAAPATAGGDAPMEPAPEHALAVHQISMYEADELLADPGVTFYDVNTLEIWAQGCIPGSIFFNVGDWKKLLPADKNARLVFYCANRLCTSSEIAAYETMKLGYTQVMQMPEGIYGWKMSGRTIELP